jgi:hypothetical protein
LFAVPSRVLLVVRSFAPFMLARIAAFNVPGGGGLAVSGRRSAFGGWPSTSRTSRPFMLFGVVFFGSRALRSTACGSLRFVVAWMLFGALVLLAFRPLLFLTPRSRRFVAPSPLFFLAPGAMAATIRGCSGASADLARFGRFSA